MANVSDALPIQFWPVGSLTFNNQISPFIDKRYFYQEFLTTDTIKLQVSNEANISKSYVLKFLDTNSNLIESIPFTQSNFQGPLISPPLSFSNYNFLSGLSWNLFKYYTGQDIRDTWNWQSPGVILSDCTASGDRNSFILSPPRPDGYIYGWPPGTYSVTFNGVNSSTGPNAGQLFCTALGTSTNFSGTDIYSLVSSSNIATGSFTFTLTFTTTQYWVNIGFCFSIGAPGNISKVYLNSVSLSSAPAYETNASFNVEFQAGSLSTPIQDSFASLVINGGGSDMWVSDLVKFSSSIMTNAGWGTQLIQYNSTKNFCGINYPNDGNYFNLRIPARFFLQRTVTQQNSLALSNSQVINTSLTKKYEQFLETIYMPDYMLNKIELALAHSVRGMVTINGVQWTVDESFDRASPDPKFAFQMGKVWLTRQNYYVRNII